MRDDDVLPHLKTLIDSIESCGFKVKLTMHDRTRSSYDANILAEADLVIVGTSDLDNSTPNIGKGVHDEIWRACFDLDIPVGILTRNGGDYYWLQGIDCETIDDDLIITDQSSWKEGYAFLSLYGNCSYAKALNSGGCYIDHPKEVENFLVKKMGLVNFNRVHDQDSTSIPVKIQKDLFTEIYDDSNTIDIYDPREHISYPKGMVEPVDPDEDLML